jgi:hypothetical protein
MLRQCSLEKKLVTAEANVFPTGQELTTTQGTATLDANTQVDITGQLMSMQEGDETVTGNARCFCHLEMP